MSTHRASSTRRLAWCLGLVTLAMSVAGCHVATEVRPDRFAADESHPFLVRDGARLDMRDRSRVRIRGPARLHRSGDALVIVDSRGPSSVRFDDVERAYIRSPDPAGTAALLALIAAGVGGLIGIAFALADTDSRSSASPPPSSSDTDVLGLILILGLIGGI